MDFNVEFTYVLIPDVLINPMKVRNENNFLVLIPMS